MDTGCHCLDDGSVKNSRVILVVSSGALSPNVLNSLVSVSDDCHCKGYHCVDGSVCSLGRSHCKRPKMHVLQPQPTNAAHSILRWDTEGVECTDRMPSAVLLSQQQRVCPVCDVSQDDKRLLSASVDRYAKVWDSSTGSLCYSLGPHPDCVRSASFSQDNRFICTGCDDGTVRVWNTSDGRELAVCSKHDGWVTSLLVLK
ncbi:wD repeat domain [Desmophyllum pertusum]|uniref:WD repeat domain n=1 Tax=Desmophyllum pertusum TaxID=174260 RepID=A0A9W9Z239_9CNID|nr:wD repeat domain [Desmophyllum pertusum]